MLSETGSVHPKQRNRFYFQTKKQPPLRMGGKQHIKGKITNIPFLNLCQWILVSSLHAKSTLKIHLNVILFAQNSTFFLTADFLTSAGS